MYNSDGTFLSCLNNFDDYKNALVGNLEDRKFLKLAIYASTSPKVQSPIPLLFTADIHSIPKETGEKRLKL
jgi:hypothetical protein